MTASPFRFGLERVRELRVHDEDRAKEAFASSLNERARGAAMLAAAHQQLADAQQAGRGAAGSGQELLLRQAWVERLERSTADAQLALHALDTELQSRRDSLTEASRNREVLERLKERRKAEHVAHLARLDAAETDEIALRGHARRTA